jgi:hypothetical protein
VPSTVIVSPASSATFAVASAAPIADAAIMLCPQACPIPGKLSYSAQIPMCRGPDPIRAENDVGKSRIPFSTWKPAASRCPQSQVDAFSSSQPTSGFAWMR